MSNALAIGKPGTVIATLAQDYAFGRDFVTAFKTALASTGAKLVFEEYAPPLTTDFTAPIQRIFDALAKEQGRKIIFVNWAGGGNPLAALKAMGPEGWASRYPPAPTSCRRSLPTRIFRDWKALPITITKFRRTR